MGKMEGERIRMSIIGLAIMKFQIKLWEMSRQTSPERDTHVEA